jgi:hypothetical protein
MRSESQSRFIKYSQASDFSPRLRSVRLSLPRRDKRVSYREVCQPNQRAGSDECRRTGGKNPDSIKKDRVYLGIDEQAAHRWSAYRPIFKSVQVVFFLVVPETALEIVGEDARFAYISTLRCRRRGRDEGRVGRSSSSAGELEGRCPVNDAPKQTKFGI